MKNEATRYHHFDKAEYDAFNLAVTQAIDLAPSELADDVIEKLDLVPDNDYDVWIVFTVDEYVCLANLVELGVKEFGEDNFTEEELSTLIEFVDEVKYS